MRRTVILALLALTLPPAPALAADTWVGPLGSDLNDCSQPAPCATMQRASSSMPDGGTMTIVGDLPNQTLNNYRPTAPATVIYNRGVVVARVDAKGTHDVTFDGLEQGTARLYNFERSTGPTGGWTQRITVRGNTNVGSIRFLNNTTDLLIEGNLMRHGNVGVTAPGRVNASDVSRRVTITGNTFDDFEQDAIQMSDVTDVVIESNLFRNIRDDRAAAGTCHVDGSSDPNPNGLPSCYHSDGIQTAGGASNWRIERNLLTDVATQGMILQGNTTAVPRPTTGVTIRRNAIVRAGDGSGPTNGMQINGVFGALIEQNIVCGRLNGLVFSPYGSSAVPTDGIVRNNIVSKYVEQAPAAADDSGNVVVGC